MGAAGLAGKLLVLRPLPDPVSGLDGVFELVGLVGIVLVVVVVGVQGV